MKARILFVIVMVLALTLPAFSVAFAVPPPVPDINGGASWRWMDVQGSV